MAALEWTFWPRAWTRRQLNHHELGDAIFDRLIARYEAKEKLIGAEAMRQHERVIMLSVLDQLWKDHLLQMDHLKEGIGLRGYGQHDPLVEYKRESFTLFEEMMEHFEEETVRYLYMMRVVDENGDEISYAARSSRGSAAAEAAEAEPVLQAAVASGRRREPVRRGGCRLRWTTWRSNSSGASRANWSRHGEPEQDRRKRCSRWFAEKRLDATIPAHAAAARNTRSATGRTNSPLWEVERLRSRAPEFFFLRSETTGWARAG